MSSRVWTGGTSNAGFKFQLVLAAHVLPSKDLCPPFHSVCDFQRWVRCLVRFGFLIIHFGTSKKDSVFLVYHVAMSSWGTEAKLLQPVYELLGLNSVRIWNKPTEIYMFNVQDFIHWMRQWVIFFPNSWFKPSDILIKITAQSTVNSGV